MSLSLCVAASAQQSSTRSNPKPDSKSTSSKSSKPDPADAKGKTAKGKDEKSGKKVASLGDGKPMLLESFHDWGAYVAQGRDKTCYALASPKERAPSTLKRDPAYVFISSRPSENVRNEVSIIMGFAMNDKAEAKAEIGNASYDLIAKGTNAWVKNPAQENQFIDALKKG